MEIEAVTPRPWGLGEAVRVMGKDCDVGSFGPWASDTQEARCGLGRRNLVCSALWVPKCSMRTAGGVLWGGARSFTKKLHAAFVPSAPAFRRPGYRVPPAEDMVTGATSEVVSLRH